MESHECVTTDLITCSKCKEVKPRSRYATSRGKTIAQCKDCSNAYHREHYKTNAEKVCARTSAYAKANAEQVSKVQAEWYLRNKEHVKERGAKYRSSEEVKLHESLRSAKYYDDRKEAIQAKRKTKVDADPLARKRLQANSKSHYEQNKAMYYAKYVKRMRVQKMATPTWANLEAIVNIYKQSIDISAKLGIRYVVDHIIPLNGKNVCGLHVEYNLQVITETENLTKSNKLIEG